MTGRQPIVRTYVNCEYGELDVAQVDVVQLL